MITIRPAEARGRFDHGWLDTRHTFSFADYHDPRHMGYRTLRVINDDRIEPGRGFPMHPHRDMEIITYVISGALAHHDSLGNGSIIRPGDAQRMTAGRGILHSEANASDAEPVRLLQIWIIPETLGLDPGYEQRHFDDAARRNELALIASPDARNGSIRVHQKLDLYSTLLDPGRSVSVGMTPAQAAWVQVAEGAVSVNDTDLREGDGAAVEATEVLRMTASEAANVLVFVMD